MNSESLSSRERDIILYVIDGLSNQEISQLLSISRATVKWHIRQLNARFHTKNRSELAQYVQRWHLTDEGGLLRNEPVQVTPFVGRQYDIASISQQILTAQNRLVTLLGAGGIGKTRLAVQVARNCASEFEQGAVYVALQGVSDGRLLVSTIAKSIGLLGGSQQTLEQSLEQLAQYLEKKPMLIVLDNMEHLLAAKNSLADLLQRTSQPKFLVTSRERLNLQQEQIYLVEGLHFPTQKDQSTASIDYDAVQLFAKRAERTQPNFDIEHELDDVIRICQIVGGMPLALELAASWRNVLNCADIVRELDQNMEVLSTELHDVPDRHKSIKVVFDQTWRYLSKNEQKIYARLSIFQGGFQRDAAEKIAGASLLPLSKLIGKAIIRMNDDGRYDLHELIRQYGLERLTEDRTEEVLTRTTYADYFADFVQDRMNDMSGGEQLKASTEISQDMDNIRAAIQWAFQTQSTSLIARLCNESLALFFQYESHYLEALQTFRQAVDILNKKSPDAERDLALLNALKSLTWFQLRLGYFDEIDVTVQQAMVIYEGLDEIPTNVHLSDPRVMLSFASVVRGNAQQAIDIANQILQAGIRLHKLVDQQFANYLLADAYQVQGQLDLALKYAGDALALSHSTGDKWFSAYILNKLGSLYMSLEDYETARRYFLDSHNIRQPFGDIEGTAVALNSLGNVEMAEKRYVEAQKYYRQSLESYLKISDTGGLASTHRCLALTAYKLGHPDSAQAHTLTAIELAVKIKFRTLLFDILMDVYQYLMNADYPQHSMMLLAFIINQQGENHASYATMKKMLQDYQSRVTPEAFETAVAKGNALSLDQFVVELGQVLISRHIFQANPDKDAELDALTAREIEVLNLISAGFSNAEIADKLTIAIGTVKYYTSQIYSKLDVTGRMRAVQEAQKRHLI